MSVAARSTTRRRALGYGRIGGLRLSVGQEDIVLAQITKSVLPFLGDGARLPPLALDHLELIIGAHVVQRYGSVKQRVVAGSGAGSAWQRRRATELLRESLDGKVRLADLARRCDLSVSPLRAFVQGELRHEQPPLASPTGDRARPGAARAHARWPTSRASPGSSIRPRSREPSTASSG